MIKEEWKPLKESSNYLVSNTGKIKSLNVNKKDGGIEMKHNIGDTGYHRVVISIKDKCKLIAKSFVNSTGHIKDTTSGFSVSNISLISLCL